jgi:hypothetical protein
MTDSFVLPTRQVHLDFHTSPHIKDVGVDFDAQEFARAMKNARVNSVTVFAKCHHGHLYYPTSRPERHPGLERGFNLLGQQIEALHGQNIRAPIYISVQCDEYAADLHPDWVARKADGSQVKWATGVFSPGWQILDMSSPYQEYLAEQTRGVLDLFKPVDGIFFDMCWDQPSTSKWAIEKMVRSGLDPESESDRAAYSHSVAQAYTRRFFQMVKSATPTASVFFNGRPLSYLGEEMASLTHYEIEALPSGGWGYMFFPKNVRWVRTHARTYMGVTARFHKSWADFGGLKPYPALEYETSQMIAHGAACSIGDQLHPRGTLDPEAYELIGKAYRRVEAREEWLVDASPVVDVGLFFLPVDAADPHAKESRAGSDEGATRMLMQLKHQFNVVDANSPLDSFKLLVLPDAIPLSDKVISRLNAYLANGGAILASGRSCLTADASASALPALGIAAHGESPYTATYFRAEETSNPILARTDHVIYERSVRVTPLAGTTSLARVVEPYFERAWNHFCSHHQTPPDKPSRYSAATINGRVGYIAYPIFSAFEKHGNLAFRWLVEELLNRLLPEPLLRVEAPAKTEATVMRQKNRTIVHLLYYPAERRTKDLDIVDDIVPLHDVRISLRLASKPAKVYLAPDRTNLDFVHEKGRVNVVVPRVNGHAMIVFE